jgi:hypothetical protein
MFSDGDAADILAKHAATSVKVPTAVSKILEDSRNSVTNVVRVAAAVEGTPYVYADMALDIEGPRPPSESEVKSVQFTAHVRPLEVHELAAGFSEDMACLRSLQDAMSGLYFSTSKVLEAV